jgi:Protein of unknown function (DUF4231)
MQPPSTEDTPDPIWQRLEDQIEWYEAKSAQAQRTYKRLKIVQIIVGAMIPFFAGFQEQLKAGLPDRLDLLPALLIAALGVIVVVLEGVQHLNQYQKTWLDYRSTAEALKHEKFLFLAGAGPYVSAEDKRARLAERIEELIASEHSRWVSVRTPSEGRSRE